MPFSCNKCSRQFSSIYALAGHRRWESSQEQAGLPPSKGVAPAAPASPLSLPIQPEQGELLISKNEAPPLPPPQSERVVGRDDLVCPFCKATDIYLFGRHDWPQDLQCGTCLRVTDALRFIPSFAPRYGPLGKQLA